MFCFHRASSPSTNATKWCVRLRGERGPCSAERSRPPTLAVTSASPISVERVARGRRGAARGYCSRPHTNTNELCCRKWAHVKHSRVYKIAYSMVVNQEHAMSGSRPSKSKYMQVTNWSLESLFVCACFTVRGAGGTDGIKKLKFPIPCLSYTGSASRYVVSITTVVHSFIKNSS